MNKNIAAFEKIYSELIVKFIKKIKNINIDGLPAPHLPVFGKSYINSTHKIAFFGKETNGFASMKEFVEDANKNLRSAIYWTEGEFDNFEFLNWTNNFKTSFFDFIIQFLSKFYQINDEKLLKDEGKNILSSFIWGNTNSFESYETVVKNSKKKIKKSDWEQVKDASLIFDQSQYALKTLKPKLMLILDWGQDEGWLTCNFKDNGHEEIDDHIWYYYIKETDTHVYWLAHPRWIAPKIKFDVYIDKILLSIKKKKIFNKPPEVKEEIKKVIYNDKNIPFNISSTEYKRQYLLSLAQFLCEHNRVMSGSELCCHFNRNNILTGYGTRYEGGRGIYTLIRNTWSWFKEVKNEDRNAKYIAMAFVKEDGSYAYK